VEARTQNPIEQMAGVNTVTIEQVAADPRAGVIGE
jgi:hypothetical protein